jgi:hypothetical protein
MPHAAYRMPQARDERASRRNGVGRGRAHGGAASRAGGRERGTRRPRTFVRKHVHLQRIGHIGPEAEDNPEVLRIGVRDEDLRRARGVEGA